MLQYLIIVVGKVLVVKVLLFVIMEVMIGEEEKEEKVLILYEKVLVL